MFYFVVVTTSRSHTKNVRIYTAQYVLFFFFLFLLFWGCCWLTCRCVFTLVMMMMVYVHSGNVLDLWL